MILDAPPKGWRRPHIPVRIKRILLTRYLQAHVSPSAVGKGESISDTGAVEIMRGVLARAGLRHIHIDHRPPLCERKFDTKRNDTIPAANNLNYLEALDYKEHSTRTDGPGGQRRITSAGSDRNRRDKRRRWAEKNAAHARSMGRSRRHKAKSKWRWPRGRKVRRYRR